MAPYYCYYHHRWHLTLRFRTLYPQGFNGLTHWFTLYFGALDQDSPYYEYWNAIYDLSVEAVEQDE